MEPTDSLEFLDEFRAEAREHIAALDAQLLDLERDPADPRPIREMFLSAHTIKGGAGMLSLHAIHALAHAIEDVLGHLRDQHQPLDPATADLLFRALDRLREQVEQSVPGADASPVDADLIAALRRCLSAGVPSASAAPSEGRASRQPRALLV